MFGCDTALQKKKKGCEFKVRCDLFHLFVCYYRSDLRERFHLFAELFNERQFHICIFYNLDCHWLTVIFSFVYYTKSSLTELFRSTDIEVAK